jgi:chromosome segregation ATPase
MKSIKTDAPPESLSPRDQEVDKKLAALKNEYNQLRDQKITTEANIKTLQGNLDKLRTEAQKEYGTSDIAQLQAILEERRRENERLVAAYEEHIQGIKAGLSAIEQGQDGQE